MSSPPSSLSRHLPRPAVRPGFFLSGEVAPGIRSKQSRERYWFAALSGQNAQRERLADSLSAVQHTQLAQDLLHVILRRQGTDLEDHPDLDIALAPVDPLEDLPLPRGEKARHRRPRSRAFRLPVDLGADPGRVQEGYQQLDVIRLRSEERRVGKECRSRWSPYH